MSGEDKEMDSLRRWLPVIIVAGGLAVSWGTFQTQLTVLADEVTELRTADANSGRREAQDKAEVAELKANQRAIKEDIQEIKENQKEQGQKLDKILEELRKN